MANCSACRNFTISGLAKYELNILGPPGVGKGTQAKHICEYYNILHLSTGDILRNEIKNASKIGLTAKSFIDKGALVPDNVLLDLIDARLNKHDAQSGYILDGFPRTIAQAEGLNNLMSEKSHHLDAVISLTADEEELINRLIKEGRILEEAMIRQQSSSKDRKFIGNKLLR